MKVEAWMMYDNSGSKLRILDWGEKKMKKNLPKDPDLLGSMTALKRSAASALKLARKTRTPCYVFEDGKIVDATKRPSRSPKKGAA